MMEVLNSNVWDVAQTETAKELKSRKSAQRAGSKDKHKAKRDEMKIKAKRAAFGEPEIDDSEYADDTALCYVSRRDAEQQTGPLMAHFGDWGMEVHAGKPGKNSKSEILFCPAPPHVYADAATYDGADLSDVQLPAGRSMPIVTKFPYLGDFVAADGTDALAVEARITAAHSQEAEDEVSAELQRAALLAKWLKNSEEA